MRSVFGGVVKDHSLILRIRRQELSWKRYLSDAIISKGTDSIWNDNCEYDSLMDNPKDDIVNYGRREAARSVS